MRARARTAHSNGLTFFIMSVMMLTAIDSSNIMDVNTTPEFRETLATVMLMYLLAIAYIAFRDIRRFRLLLAILTVTFHK